MPLREWPSHSFLPALMFSLAVHGLVVSVLSLSGGSWELRQVFQPASTVSVALAQNPAPELVEDSYREMVEEASEDLAEGAIYDMAEGSFYSMAEGSLTQPTVPDVTDLPFEAMSPRMPTVALAEYAGPTRVSVAAPSISIPVNEAQRRELTTRLESLPAALSAKGDLPRSVTWEQGGQTFTAKISRSRSATATDLERATIEVSTTVDGVKLSTQVSMKRIAFSHFAQFVDVWASDVLMSREQIGGRFHSNTAIRVDPFPGGGPSVRGKTTVAATVSMHGQSSRSGVFEGGLQTHARRIPMPDRPWLWLDPQNESHTQIHYLDEDAEITFDSGGYNWRTFADPPTTGRISAINSPWFIVARNNARLHVSGKVKGSVLVYSPRRIVIVGDLTYDRDPRIHYDSQDFLGLVSDRNVEIAGPKITGTGDLSIFASIYAKRRFVVDGYRKSGYAQLTIYGSVTARTLSATEPRFDSNLIYDKRLDQQRAPHFPMTDGYVLENWDPQWLVATSADTSF